MMKYKEELIKPSFGMLVYHEDIYKGNEMMKVVGLRELEVELEGDYSGGTHSVKGVSWLPIKGLFRYRKVCYQQEKYGSCQLPNVHCGYPECEPYVDVNDNQIKP
jgi:hypothetical protein